MADVMVTHNDDIYRGWVSKSTNKWYPTVRAGELAEPQTSEWERSDLDERKKK